MTSQAKNTTTTTTTTTTRSVLDAILAATAAANAAPVAAPVAAPRASLGVSRFFRKAPSLTAAPVVTGGVAQFVAPAVIVAAPNPFAPMAPKAVKAAPAPVKAAPAPKAVKAAPRVKDYLDASPKRLRGGAWGGRVADSEATPKVGDRVKITTKGGKTWYAYVSQVWGRSFATSKSKPKAAPAAQICPGDNRCRTHGLTQGPRCSPRGRRW